MTTSTPRPPCPRCGHRATLVPETTGQWAAWCACAAVRGAEHRPVARAATADEALEAWREAVLGSPELPPGPPIEV